MPEFKCNSCGDTVWEPRADEEWECVLCGGWMEMVSKTKI